MQLGLDSFWRACLSFCHPRTWGLAMLPLLVLTVLAWGLGSFFWDAALDQISGLLRDPRWLKVGESWLDALGWGRLKPVLAPLLVIVSVTPLLVITSLCVVMAWMLPGLVRGVVGRRFADLALQGRRGRVGWPCLQALLTAIFALVVSSPLWLVPPLVWVMPPLIWAWLCYRVMPSRVLAAYASPEERQSLSRKHRLAWGLMAGLSGALAALPGFIWASGTGLVTAFAVLAPLAMGLYVAIFTLAGLWFAHHGLAALQELRKTRFLPGA